VYLWLKGLQERERDALTGKNALMPKRGKTIELEHPEI
jgi:hypothetical protein